IQEYDDLVRHKQVLGELAEYANTKELLEEYLEKADPRQREEYEKITRNEKDFLQSNNKYQIREKMKALDGLLNNIYNKQEDRYIDTFYFYRMFEDTAYRDARKFHKLVDLGDKAVEKNNYKELRAIC